MSGSVTEGRPQRLYGALWACMVLGVALACALASLGTAGCVPSVESEDVEGVTSGPPYREPTSVLTAPFGDLSVDRDAPAAIDAAHCSDGYAVFAAMSASRLKARVRCGQMSYHYDLPRDGTPIVVPMNMGDGLYELSVMENTVGTSYAEVFSETVEVVLESEFAPYLRPNLFCDYAPESACAVKARELAVGAENQGDAVRAVYLWMMDAISYDERKAERLSGTSGYVPDPDATLESGSGICFDYASLAAAMFRSLGIPCQIVTGNVAPEDVYHAWNLIYIDGEWVSALITVSPDDWTRIDLTFAASEGDEYERRDDAHYTERYRY